MFLTYLTRELRRRRRQAIVIALGLALGIGLTITVTAASAGVKAAQNAVLHSLYGVGTDMAVTSNAKPGSGGAQFRFGGPPPGGTATPTTQDTLIPAPGTSTISAATAAKIKKVDGVAAAVASLNLVDLKTTSTALPNQGTSSSGSTGGGADISASSANVAGVDTSDPALGPMSSLTASSGRLLKYSDDAGKYDAVVTKSYAESAGLKLGGTLTLGGKAFAVVGIATGASNDDVYVPLGIAQSLASQEGKVSEVYVTADNSTEIDAVAAAIGRIDANLTVTTASDLASTVTGSLDSTASLADTLGRWLEILVLIAAFTVAVLLTMSAVGRRVTEFGTLKALGWASKRVVRQVVGEGIVIGLAGGAAGILLGLAGAFAIDRLAPALTASTGGTTPVSGSGTNGGGPVVSQGTGPAKSISGPTGSGSNPANSIVEHLTAPVSVEILLVAVALAVLGGLIAGGFGGWRASALRPADALRKVA